MTRLFLYLEVLIFATVYRIIAGPINFIVSELHLLGRTADTYSKLDCHFWQQSKVHIRYQQAKEAYEKKVKDGKGR